MIKGIIFDLDGTIYLGDSLLPGTNAMFECLRSYNIPFVFVTNTTSLSTTEIQAKLVKLGLNVSLGSILTPVQTAKAFFYMKGFSNIRIFRCKSLESEFIDFNLSTQIPDAVLLADDGTGLTYQEINEVFNLHLQGSLLTTLQKNKYYSIGGEVIADLGVYTAGLEYITGKEIINFGKPSCELFSLAQKKLGVEERNCIAVVGDDIEFDIIGAQKHGYDGFLVRTGKYRQSEINDHANHIIEKASDIVDFLSIGGKSE